MVGHCRAAIPLYSNRTSTQKNAPTMNHSWRDRESSDGEYYIFLVIFEFSSETRG